VSPQCVGRETELAHIEHQLAMAIADHGHVLLITGEAGVGKTFLVEQFIGLAEDRYPDIQVARGQCSERFGRGEGYLPFIEALGALLSGRKDASARQKILEIALDTAPSWLEAIPAVGQALRASYETAQAARERFGGHAKQLSAPDREHVLQEYAGVLTRLSEDRPILLFLDDLQWSDGASVDLLVHLSRRIGGNAILIAGTYRPSDVAVGRGGEPHPLKKAVLDMRRYSVCHEIALERLGRRDCQALVSSEFANNTFPGSFIDLLYEHSEGNALFITETLHLLREKGLIQQRDGAWHLARSARDLPVPSSVESVVSLRIDRLGADVRKALRYASAEGERFLSTVLAEVLQTDELELEERLAIAEHVHRLIASTGAVEFGWDLSTVYEFTHTLFRETLYEHLAPKERVLLHRRTGLALEELYGDAAPEIASELAVHFREGRLFDKAFEYSLAAARRAKRLYAVQEAIDHFQQARKHLERVEGTREQRLVIAEGLADMLSLQASYDLALAHLERARDLIEDTDRMPEPLARLCRKTGMLHERKGAYEEAFAWLERGLGLLDGDGSLEGARIRLTGAGIHSRQGSHQSALDWCRAGLDTARRESSQIEVAHGTYLLGTIHWHLGHIDAMVACSRKSLDLYESLGDLAGQAKTLHNLGIACTESGAWRAALKHFRHAIELENRMGDVHAVAKTTNSLGVLMLHRGETSAAAKAYRRCLDIWKGIDFPIGIALVYSNLSEVCMARQEWEKALRYLHRSEEILQEIESDLFLPEVYRRQALVHLNTDDLAQAKQCVDRSLALANDLDMTMEKGISLRVSGAVHRLSREWEQAENALVQSAEILHEQGNQYQMAETLYQIGKLYLDVTRADDRDATAKAASALESARIIFEKLGAKHALASVKETLR